MEIKELKQIILNGGATLNSTGKQALKTIYNFLRKLKNMSYVQ